VSDVPRAIYQWRAFVAAIVLMVCFCVVAPEVSPAAQGSTVGTSLQSTTAIPSGPAKAAVEPKAEPGGVPAELLPRDLSPWEMFLSAAVVVKAVMLLLVLASVLTWTVCLSKSLELTQAKRKARSVVGVLAQVASLNGIGDSLPKGSGPAGDLIAAASDELKVSSDLSAEGIKERIVIRLERIEVAARQAMARGTGLLATIGSIAPFVGLFGTVWGIMQSFIGISKAQTTNLAIVAPGIAEALLATALGLVAAIPAVIIYNAFARAITGYRTLLEDVSAQVMRLVSRDLDQAREEAPLRTKAAR
jgi:biopolymer transport protein ExbB